MKYLYSLVIAMCLGTSVNAQITIDYITFPNIGDSSARYVDVAPEGVEITDAGPDQTWTWELTPDETYFIHYDSNDRTDIYPFATTKVTDGGVSNYFSINTDAWYLMGTSGADPLGAGFAVEAFYTPALIEEYAPLAYEDSLDQNLDVYTGIPLSLFPDSILDQLPLVPDSLRARIATTVEEDVDAWGTLDINGESTEVLRQRRETRIGIRLEAKISILPWTDVTDLILDYLDALPIDLALNDTILSYRFLAPNFGLPVAEISVDSNVVVSVDYQLEILSGLRSAPVLTEFDLYPNPSSGLVTLNLGDITEDVDRVTAFDATGRPVLSRSLSGNVNQELNFGQMATGLYVVTLWSSEGTLIGMKKLQIVQ